LSRVGLVIDMNIAEKHYSEENLALGNLALKRKPSIDVTTQ